MEEATSGWVKWRCGAAPAPLRVQSHDGASAGLRSSAVGSEGTGAARGERIKVTVRLCWVTEAWTGRTGVGW